MTEPIVSRLQAGLIDLAAFGQPFIGNPDLMARLSNGWVVERARS
jgi:2,4-dienoyl-CoA reductase-like NADH-dependent reductase (Old Yellow Enzyme family)